MTEQEEIILTKQDIYRRIARRFEDGDILIYWQKIKDDKWSISSGGTSLTLDEIRKLSEFLPREKCHWTPPDDQDLIETECGESFTFNDGGIEENHFKYCPFCGREVEG